MQVGERAADTRPACWDNCPPVQGHRPLCPFTPPSAAHHGGVDVGLASSVLLDEALSLQDQRPEHKGR